MSSPCKNSCELLESRRLFSGIGVSHHHVLDVLGGASSNVITVGLSPDQLSVVATVSYQTMAGPKALSATLPLAGLSGILIRGGPNPDLITIDQTNGSFTLPTEIFAGNGNDTIYGGDEPDNIVAGQGNDYVDAGNGINRVLGNGGSDTLVGGNGTNILLGNDGSDSLIGGSGADTLFGQVGSDTLIGNDGNDILRGGPGRDSLSGGEGNDILYDVSPRNTLMGGDGQNTFAVRTIRGNPSNDYRAGTDVLKRIAPPSDKSSFWDDVLNYYLY